MKKTSIKINKKLIKTSNLSKIRIGLFNQRKKMSNNQINKLQRNHLSNNYNKKKLNKNRIL